MICAILSVFAVAAPFDKVALIDDLDYAHMPWPHDIETKEGVEAVVRNALKCGATRVFWRSQQGALPRYPNVGEARPFPENPIDKRRAACTSRRDSYGAWVNYTTGNVRTIATAAAYCREQGVGFGLHYPIEHNHFNLFFFSGWNFDRPEYWCKLGSGAPWPGRVSHAYPEVRRHAASMILESMRDFEGGVFYCDTFRSGAWTPAFEHVAPVEARWRELHPGEPVPSDGEEWCKVVAEFENRWYRGLSRLARQKGREFWLTIDFVRPDGSDHTFRARGFEWEKLLAEGALDAVVVASMLPDKKDLWGSTERAYRAIMGKVGGRAKVYFPVMAYNIGRTRPGFKQYAEWSGLSQPEAATRLMELAVQVGGAGVVLECVDISNYPDDVCRTIAAFRASECNQNECSTETSPR